MNLYTNLIGFCVVISTCFGCIITDGDPYSQDVNADSYAHSNPLVEEGCIYDTECYEAEYCDADGLCFATDGCTHHSDCGRNAACIQQSCQNVDGCTLDSECGPGGFCNAGECELIGPCAFHLDCPTAMFCSFDALCEPLPPGQCIVSEDCFGGQVCSQSGYCYDSIN